MLERRQLPGPSLRIAAKTAPRHHPATCPTAVGAVKIHPKSACFRPATRLPSGLVNAPVLLAFPIDEREWKAWCPFCEAWHFHGPGEGHREAHCAGTNDDSPFIKSGYVLRRFDRAQHEDPMVALLGVTKSERPLAA